jgi:hypothetical protein
MEVFHQFRENLKALKADVSRENSQAGRETSEYCSEVSEDYNSADGSTSEARWAGLYSCTKTEHISIILV